MFRKCRKSDGKVSKSDVKVTEKCRKSDGNDGFR